MSPSRQNGRGRRLFRLALGILVLSLTVRLGPGTDPSASNGAVELHEPEGDERWYTPDPGDYRPLYDRDTANRQKQTWDQYWRWVKVFYEGNFLSAGWTERSIGLVSDVQSAAELKKLRATINAVGREISAEWSKDYAVGKVNTADLLAWGQMLQKAKAKDNGSGAEIRRTIESILPACRKRLAGPEPLTSPH